MAKLVVLITTHVEKTLEIAEAWQKAGAPGVTLVPSHGFRTLKARSRKLELPHFVNLATILKQVDDTTQMLLSVVDEGSTSTSPLAGSMRNAGSSRMCGGMRSRKQMKRYVSTTRFGPVSGLRRRRLVVSAPTTES